MNICCDEHDKIVFECKRCPLCESIAQRMELERHLDNLKEEIDSLNKEELKGKGGK